MATNRHATFWMFIWKWLSVRLIKATVIGGVFLRGGGGGGEGGAGGWVTVKTVYVFL